MTLEFESHSRIILRVAFLLTFIHSRCQISNMMCVKY